jgi:HEAT repeat protein
VAKLKNTDWEVRQAVVETLGKLEPEMLAMCSDAIAAKLRDQSEVDIVRRTVMNTLGKLNPDKLQMHSMEIVATFESSDWRVRKATIETLSKLRPEEIAKQVDPKTIIAKLDQDHHENVREASADFLDTLICSQRAATFLQALSRGWLARIRRNEAKKLQDTLTPGKDIV